MGPAMILSNPIRALGSSWRSAGSTPGSGRDETTPPGEPPSPASSWPGKYCSLVIEAGWLGPERRDEN